MHQEEVSKAGTPLRISLPSIRDSCRSTSRARVLANGGFTGLTKLSKDEIVKFDLKEKENSGGKDIAINLRLANGSKASARPQKPKPSVKELMVGCPAPPASSALPHSRALACGMPL